DLDSQGHATQHLGLAAESLERTVFEILVNGAPIEDVIVPHALAEFDVLPANLRMTTIDISLMPMAGREYKLQRARAGVLDRYEFIVMDAPPSFGLLNLNALMASDDLLVPVLPDFLSFHGLKLLFETLGQLEDDLNHRLQRIKIVINQYNPTTRIAREAKAALESHYAEFLSETIVRQCTQFARASSDGLPINAYAPSSKGARDIEAMRARLESAIEERTRLAGELEEARAALSRSEVELKKERRARSALEAQAEERRRIAEEAVAEAEALAAERDQVLEEITGLRGLEDQAALLQ